MVESRKDTDTNEGDVLAKRNKEGGEWVELRWIGIVVVRKVAETFRSRWLTTTCFDSRGAPHDILNFFKTGSVELKRRNRMRELTPFE